MKKSKSYTAPSLVRYGGVEDITRGQDSGDFTDQDFPDKTPTDDLTFSN